MIGRTQPKNTTGKCLKTKIFLYFTFKQKILLMSS